MERPTPLSRAGAMRATLSGDGCPGPIEERIGRRLIRLVDPESDEGRELLVEGSVELLGPGGEHFGRMSVTEAYRALERRIEERLELEPPGPPRQALEEGLKRLRERTRKLDH